MRSVNPNNVEAVLSLPFKGSQLVGTADKAKRQTKQ